MKDAVDLKHIGKLGEETGELSAAIARCIIQGLRDGEHEPVTKKPNKRWLEEELADVLANAYLVIERFDLDREFIADRMDRKTVGLKRWHDMA